MKHQLNRSFQEPANQEPAKYSVIHQINYAVFGVAGNFFPTTEQIKEATHHLMMHRSENSNYLTQKVHIVRYRPKSRVGTAPDAEILELHEYTNLEAYLLCQNVPAFCHKGTVVCNIGDWKAGEVVSNLIDKNTKKWWAKN